MYIKLGKQRNFQYLKMYHYYNLNTQNQSIKHNFYNFMMICNIHYLKLKKNLISMSCKLKQKYMINNQKNKWSKLHYLNIFLLHMHRKLQQNQNLNKLNNLQMYSSTNCWKAMKNLFNNLCIHLMMCQICSFLDMHNKFLLIIIFQCHMKNKSWIQMININNNCL